MSDEKPFCPVCGLAMAPGNGKQECPHCLLRLALTAEEETDLADRRSKEALSLPSGLRSRFFADYELLEEIARGGMGVIYKARQLSLNRLVALKMIQASHLLSAEARLRFRMEVEAVAQLNHPHIVPLYESGEHEGAHYFSMRLVERGSLARELACPENRKSRSAPGRRHPFLLATFSVGNFVQIARAVHYAHQRGILHRDLKPSNILIDAQGEPHVVDFGLAKMLAHDSGFTFTESILGSPNYMAPEQASGFPALVTVSADVYGLGAILYELLTGQPPFMAATPIDTIRKVLDEEAIPPRKLNPAVDPDLDTICLKCLRKDPAGRYASADELASDLDRWLEGRPILARPLGVIEHAWRWCRRQPALAAALGLSGILLVALAVGTAIAGVRIHRAERRAAAHRQESFLGEARALRLASEIGDRSQALRLIRDAAALGGSEDFRQRARDEVLAQISRIDVSFVPQPRLGVSPDPWLNLVDPKFRQVATVSDRTNVVILSLGKEVANRRFGTDDQPVVRFDSFSKDGRFLAVVHPDGWSVWDVDSGRRCFSTNVTSPAFAFAPDRAILVLQDSPSQLSLLELPSGIPLDRRIIETGGPPDRPYRWNCLSVSPDGRTVAAARSGSRVLELIDLESGRITKRMTNGSRCTAMVWSEDGATLALATADGRLLTRLIPSGRRTFLTRPNPSAARRLALNKEATLLAASFPDRHVQLFDLTAARLVFTYPCDSEQIEFDSMGSRVGPMLRGLEFGWLEFQRPAEFYEFGCDRSSIELIGCRFSPDGTLLVTGTLTNIVICDPASGARLLRLVGIRFPAFAFQPTGLGMLAAGTPGLFEFPLRRREGALDRGSRTGILPGAGWRAFTFSERHDWFVAANVRSNAAYLFDRRITNKLAEVGPHVGPDSVAVSPNGRWIATGSTTDRQLKIWATESGAEVLTLSIGPRPQAVFSADGKWLAAFGDGFRLYATDSWRPAPELPFPDDSPVIGASAFSPDGRVLAIICNLNTVLLVDLVSWRSLGSLQLPNPRKLTGLAFSADGSRLAACGDLARIRIWDLRKIREHLSDLGLGWGMSLPATARTD
jgi:WD40 repeat protein